MEAPASISGGTRLIWTEALGRRPKAPGRRACMSAICSFSFSISSALPASVLG